MKISAKTEYACIAMIELAAAFGTGEPVRIRKIAERHSVPPRFLVQILLQLKGAGFVSSTRGAAGGYNLIVPPEDITLGKVMDVIDGQLSTQQWTTNASETSPAVQALMVQWKTAEQRKRDILDGVTFADLLAQTKKNDKQSFYS